MRKTSSACTIAGGFELFVAELLGSEGGWLRHCECATVALSALSVYSTHHCLPADMVHSTAAPVKFGERPLMQSGFTDGRDASSKLEVWPEGAHLQVHR